MMASKGYAVYSFTMESIQICSLRSFPKILPNSKLGRQETEVPELAGFMVFLYGFFLLFCYYGLSDFSVYFGWWSVGRRRFCYQAVSYLLCSGAPRPHCISTPGSRSIADLGPG